jgi:hypothetical protein
MPGAERGLAVTAPCERYTADGLQAPDAGPDLLAHVAACPDCSARKQRYDSIQHALRLEPGRGLKPGWQAAVLAAARAEARAEARSPVRGRRWLLVAAPALVAAAVALWLWPRPLQPPEQLPLIAWERVLEPADPIAKRRGPDSLNSGDLVRLYAKVDPAATVELRIYREHGGLVQRCPVAPPGPTCRRSGEDLELRWRIPAPGRYVAVVAVASGTLPEPLDTLAADTTRLVAAGAQVSTAPPIDAH